MKILEKLKEIRFSDPITQSQHILNIADKINELVDALNELEERIEKQEKLSENLVKLKAIEIEKENLLRQSAPDQTKEQKLIDRKVVNRKDGVTINTSGEIEFNVQLKKPYGDIWEVSTLQHLDKEFAEAVKAKIEKALEFYEKYYITMQDKILHRNAVSEDTDARLNNDVSPKSDHKLDLDWEKEFVDNCINEKYLIKTLNGNGIDRFTLLTDIYAWIQQARAETMPFSREDLEMIRECVFCCNHSTEDIYMEQHKNTLAKLDKMIESIGGEK